MKGRFSGYRMGVEKCEKKKICLEDVEKKF